MGTNMNWLNLPLKNAAEYRRLLSDIENGRLCPAAAGLSGIHKAHMISALCDERQCPALVIAADEGEARRLCEDLTALGQRPLYYTARDFVFKQVEGRSHEYEHMRISVLSAMVENDYTQVVCCADGLLQYTMSPETLYRRTFTLKTGGTAEPREVAAELIKSGYIRAEKVEGAGQFAVRGGIMDIFSTGAAQPYRIEFWGDEVDTVSYFDPVSQRRTESVTCAAIPPASEVLYDSPDALAEKISEHIKKLRSKNDAAAKAAAAADIEILKGGGSLASVDKYFDLCESCPATLLDYAENAMIFVSESSRLRERAHSFWVLLGEDIKSLLSSGDICRGLSDFAMSYDTLIGELQERRAIFLENFIHGSFDVKVCEPVNFNVRHLPVWNGSLSQLKEDLLPAVRSGFSCVVLAGSESSAQALADDLVRDGVNAYFESSPKRLSDKSVLVTVGGLSAGMEYPSAKLLLITHGITHQRKRRLAKRDKNSQSITNLEELRRGDYVVHAAHGIGVFEGIHKLSVDGCTKDYIKIKYKGDDILYVPVTQLDLVSRYIGPKEDGVVRVHKLGGTEWQRAKSRTRASVRDMAKQLIKLYAERAKLEGHAFAEDCDMQRDFECRFEYEETEDQLRCVSEIKADMESTVPMERLLCGDVGFGKTEVALRAAFKCIVDGMQCAILVPTTILAFQHYQTAMKRFEGFPVNIGQLSRFSSAKQQSEAIKRLESGETDLVIGTHRLISKDVKFKKLGLLIVDEEQRFGVAQKEKLKECFPTVDVLTLSATPIPRTLNMAMSGIRDMSVIEEAPQDRYPVQTYVLEHDFAVLTDAMRRELRRGGQVYYVHNRIESIERVALRIENSLPDARVAVAHGQMSEEKLSEIWRQMLEGELDILVCTTIIETGVDISNVNTLIIENADLFGLAQLHQLRGRVGRSSRRAYAYLTFNGGKALSDVAAKRLEAIREFTEFGSGFKIAMRDLEIRGAGNLLGAEQHGNMEAVGYDMYIKLLNEAVLEEQGRADEIPDSECLVDLQVEAHIPEAYISDLPQRLFIYKRIAEIRTEDDASDVIDELIDRYGEPPAAVCGLIDIAMARATAAKLGIVEVSGKDKSVLLYPKKLDMDKAGKLVSAMRGRVLVNAGSKPYYAVRRQQGQQPTDTLLEVLSVMEKTWRTLQPPDTVV